MVRFCGKEKNKTVAVVLQPGDYFDGIERFKTIAVGTHGCIKSKIIDKDYFKVVLAKLVKTLSPRTIIVYGAAPDDVFKKYRDMGIKIVTFASGGFECDRLVIHRNIAV